MEIKKLDKNETSEFIQLLEIFKNVFENDGHIPDNNHLTGLLSNPDFMVFVVKTESKVIGGLTIYVLHSYYSIKPTAYIYDVGIAPRFQGQGFGKALITCVCNFCKANGFEDAYVEAESNNVDAVNFYRKTNLVDEIDAKHFTFAFN